MSKRRKRRSQHACASHSKKLLAFFALGAVLAVLALFIYERTLKRGAEPVVAQEQARRTQRPAAAEFVEADWTVGELRPDGLRLIPSGRADASRVLDPAQFTDPEVRRAYAIAWAIPEVLNQLYCWCGCENRGVHRSNLACFEDLMSVNCAVCRGTAEIAYEMVQQGITDAGTIQAAIDARWAQ